jgi:hypothetical protein
MPVGLRGHGRRNVAAQRMTGSGRFPPFRRWNPFGAAQRRLATPYRHSSLGVRTAALKDLPDERPEDDAGRLAAVVWCAAYALFFRLKQVRIFQPD